MNGENEGQDEEQTNAPPSVFGEGVTFAENWRESLEDDVKGSPTLGKFKSLNDMARSYINAEKMIGHDTIPIPKEDSPKEVFDRIYTSLGKPESAEGYELNTLEISGFDAKSDDVKTFSEFAHGLNLNKEQAQALVKFDHERYQSALNSVTAEQQQKNEEQAHQLKAEWGMAFDHHLDTSLKAQETLGVRKLIEELGLGNHPEVQKTFFNVAKQLGEDKMVGDPSRRMTVQDARDKIAGIKQNNKYWTGDKHDPEHLRLVREMEKYMAIANVEPVLTL